MEVVDLTCKWDIDAFGVRCGALRHATRASCAAGPRTLGGMVELTGGQALARALRAEGIQVVFGIVGTHNVNLFDGLHDIPDLRVVTTRHEAGAGFMADGYARASAASPRAWSCQDPDSRTS